MKRFSYSPGLMGPGFKGRDGSLGLTGLSMLFTDLDPISDVTIIRNKIDNNQVLWSGDNTSFSGERNYQVGDIFIDKNGKIYEITLDASRFIYKNISLSTGDDFSYSGVQSSNSVKRYSNIYDFNGVFIDNLNTVVEKDYSVSPASIYGIAPLEFTRIEYCDEFSQMYYPFSVYIASDSSDNTAIAIVKDRNTASFRIGNLDSVGNIRNVDLTFDVSNLKVSRQTGNFFTASSSTGTVLSNYEINANHIFAPNLNETPSSFILTGGSGTMHIHWNKYDLLNTSSTNVINNTVVDMHFYKSIVSFNASTYNIDADVIKPLIFNDIDASGSITINSLSSGTYEAFLEATHNGWSRRTNISTEVAT